MKPNCPPIYRYIDHCSFFEFYNYRIKITKLFNAKNRVQLYYNVKHENPSTSRIVDLINWVNSGYVSLTTITLNGTKYIILFSHLF